MELRSFLETVVTGEKGWFVLQHSSESGNDLSQEWFEYPKQVDKIISRVEHLGNRNVYFSPYLFNTNKSKKDGVIVGRTIAADLDGANILLLKHKPTVLVETSSGRYQGYWILDETEALPKEQHEYNSKKLSYSIAGCDKSGWWLGHIFRIPSSYNYKWGREQEQVQVVSSTDRRLHINDLHGLPEVPAIASENGAADKDYDISDEFIAKAMTVSSGPQEYFAQIQNKLPPKIVTQYNYEAQDRSGALWALMIASFRVGLSTEQVFFLARGSANNKFTGLRYNGDRELLKDVIRARTETYGAHKFSNIKDKIDQIRRLDAPIYERLGFMAKTVVETMKRLGQFINCTDGTAWFIDNNVGKPIPIVVRAESLQIYLDSVFGINSTERECNYIISSLITHVNSMPAVGRLGSLSVYDRDSNTILLHTGRKEVLHINSREITSVVNGYDNIVFPWSSAQETISPFFDNSLINWEEILFNNSLTNLVGMKTEDAKALLKVWIIMLLLRDAVISRPILAVFGQPGAGKSTLFRRIYTLIYGRYRSLSSITTPDNYDFATAADPVVVFDNVDTFEKWLPDRLALSAAVSEVKRRKLYTNGETITLIRQAFVCLTAHNPKFGREDVSDRLLILTMERLKEFTSEVDILDFIHNHRSQLWGSILMDVQRVLATPIPMDGFPDFRIRDFAKYGYWIASAVGCTNRFTAALKHITLEQKASNLEADQGLIDTLAIVAGGKSYKEEFRTPSQWWGILTVIAKDQVDFERTYKNAVTLSKKFWTLQDSLKSMFDVEWVFDPRRGTRLWKFALKKEEHVNGIAEIGSTEKNRDSTSLIRAASQRSLRGDIN